MRVGVVDVGTNSTRLLVADVERGRATEIVRRTTVTRLGAGLRDGGRLAPDAAERVFTALAEYRRLLDEHGVERTTGVLTSAVRDASDGEAFLETVRAGYGIDARTLSGEEEARLTFLGATAERDPDDPTSVAVVDIGGGSTEIVTGARSEVAFFASLQAGVVRHGERFVAHDPPEPEELRALAADLEDLIDEAVPPAVRREVEDVIAVAGTPTSVAAIDLELDPYDPERVHGHRVGLATVERLVDRLAAMRDAERRQVVGLHPERAPTIVPGLVILLAVLRALGRDELEVSERDILHGAALALSPE